MSWQWSCWGGAAQAAPSPVPPADFFGSQYIDSRGCVFTRDNSDWVARMDGAGQPLCGFPPSLDVRRTDPGTERALPLTPQPSPDVGTLLTDQLLRDLRPGEWTADPVPMETRSTPPIPATPDPMHNVLQNALAITPKLQNTTGLSGSPELCARLGYQLSSADNLGMTGGLCAGMQVEPQIGLVAVSPNNTPLVTAPASRPVAQSAEVPRAAEPNGRRRTATVQGEPSTDQVEMIPATARYVQLGLVLDDENGRNAIRALAARGYPIARTVAGEGDQPQRLLMAGPFKDRQSLITALDELRKNGYPNAVAR